MSRFLTTIACSTLLWCGPLGGAALADGQPPAVVAIEGTHAFDWLRPDRSRCTKVKGSLLRKLKKSATCRLPEAGSASGRPIVAVCRAGKSEWMLFSTAADCKLERDTQLANGP